MLKKVCLFITVMLLSAVVARGAALPEFRHGAVVADNDAHLGLAVGDFVNYWSRIFPDRPLTLCPSAEGCEGDFKFYFGKNPIIASGELEKLSVDGYIIRSGPGALAAQGKTADGTAFGVYGLLRDLGVRFYMPTELFTFVPPADAVNIDLTGYDAVVEPDFLPRLFSGFIGEAADWARRNRADRWRQELPNLGFDHNLYNVITPEDAAEHPDYFPTINGERVLPSKDGQNINPDVCNPDVIKKATEVAISYFDKNPGAMTFSLSMNDTGKFGDSPHCRGIDPVVERTWHGEPLYSDRYFNFAAAAARALDKAHPGKQVGVLAYLSTELPPLSLEKLPENLVICITQDTSQYFDKSHRDVDRSVILQWSLRGNRISKYDYYGLSWIVPRYFPHLIAEDLVFTHAAGVNGRFTEAYPLWGTKGPMYYVALNMMWDTGQDVDELLGTLYRDLFGGAAGEVKAFFDYLEEAWSAPRQGKGGQGLGNYPEQLKSYTPSVVNRARALLDAAYAAAGDDKIRARLDFINDAFEFSRQLALSYHALDGMDERRAKETGDPAELINAINSAHDGFLKAMEIFDGRMGPTGLYSAPYYSRNPYFTKKEKKLKQKYVEFAARSLQAYARALGADRVWPAAIEGLRPPQLRALAFANTRKDLKNLLKNPGFESSGAGLAWSEWHAPQEPNEIRLSVDAGRKFSGSSAGRIEGASKGGFSQIFKARPGRFYYVSAMAYAESVTPGDVKVTLDMYWLMKPPAVTEESDHEQVPLEEEGEWVRLEHVVQAPEDVMYGFMTVMIDSNKDGLPVWFDDVLVADLGRMK